MTETTSVPLLDVRALSRRFAVHHGFRRHLLHAVEAVDIAIAPGECLGLVGESGCGKSTLARLITRLIDPSDGRILLDGRDIGTVPAGRFAGTDQRAAIQMVFQDPNESLNPGFTVFEAIADPIRRLGKKTSAATVTARALAALDDVALPREFAGRYPHQLSGGQKARVGIARAIAVNPRLVVLDEPTSALDVSVQSTILHLLADLKARRAMSYLFVSHDLNVVRLMCERIAVMYLGRIVETGPAEAMFTSPVHPYTRMLIAAIPDPARRGKPHDPFDGTPASPIDPDPDACRFVGRCPIESTVCRCVMPELAPIADGRSVACHRARDLFANPPQEASR